MRPLPETFRKDGYDYRMLARTGDVALFEQAQGGKVYAFEVVVVQRHKAGVIMGKEVPEREGMPNATQWGSAGWTLRTRPEADSKMVEIVARPVAKEAKAAAASGGARSAPSKRSATGNGLTITRDPIAPKKHA